MHSISAQIVVLLQRKCFSYFVNPSFTSLDCRRCSGCRVASITNSLPANLLLVREWCGGQLDCSRVYSEPSEKRQFDLNQRRDTAAESMYYGVRIIYA